MPVQLSYPGVYIEEVPSGVRPITGVPTSIAAFVGRASRGPVNEAVIINSFADFERTFGGLAVYSFMSFAVRDFFLNGGGKAVIVRLYKSDSDPLTEDVAKIKAGTLVLVAANPGAWGNSLEIEVDDNVSEEAAAAQGLLEADIFNLTVTDNATGASEEHRNVSIKVGPRKVDEILKNRSKLVRVDTLGGSVPTPGTYNVATQGGEMGSEGVALEEGDYVAPGLMAKKEGLYALEQADIFNLLCLPPDWDLEEDRYYPPDLFSAAKVYCEEERRAIFLVDPDPYWDEKSDAVSDVSSGTQFSGKNAAIYFPRLRQANPLKDNQIEEFVPCGAVAGVISRTDTQRGVWKAPAGIDATVNGVSGLSVPLTDPENGELNKIGVNCLRTFPLAGAVVWGARTLKGADRHASEWKYLPVRRTALFLEETLRRGLLWVVHEPNDEPLWTQIRLNVDAFMNSLFRQGAFQGQSPREAYLVKCDSETTTQDDINKGIVNIIVGFAPLKPAEFVIVKLQQLAGQATT